MTTGCTEAATPPAMVEALAVVAATGLAYVSLHEQGKDEATRRAADRQRADERRVAVDARISALAYALRRQLRSWVEEAPDEIPAQVSIVDAWSSAVQDLGGDDPGEVPGIPPQLRAAAGAWALRASGHFDHAEEQMLELMAAAPDASPDVAVALRRAYPLFYRATGRLNRQAALRQEPLEPSDVAKEITAAYHELQECIEALTPAIDVELRDQ